jgi:hypothetical protein
MGNILLSAWDVITHCESAAMGEAIACLEGLNLDIANSSANLIIKTDCSSVLHDFREDSCDRSEVCFIAKDFNRMKPPDRQVVVSKVNRNCNSVAHGVCQFSCNMCCVVECYKVRCRHACRKRPWKIVIKILFYK